MSRRLFPHLVRRGLTLAGLFAAPSLASAADGGTPYPGDLGQAVATLVIFLLLAAVLGKWAWKPIIAQLRRRDEDLATRYEDADKQQTRAEDLTREYEQKLSEFSAEREAMIAQAKKDAAAESAKILQSAREEASETVARARADIESARADARRELKDQTARLAADIARQLLREQLTAQQQQQLLSQATRHVAHRVEQESRS